jgi:hypothetical protein
MAQFFGARPLLEKAYPRLESLKRNDEGMAPLEVDNAEWGRIQERIRPQSPSSRLVEFLSKPSLLERGGFEALLKRRKSA